MSSLKGIVIDPGHGGSDPGAVANNIKEKDYNLLISKYMYDRFRSLGVPVKLTREDDSTLSPSERTAKVKSFYGTGDDVIVVSNHLNAGGGDGAEVIYALRNDNTLSKKILDGIEEEGQNVRKYYQQRLPSNPSKDYYFMHRDTPNNETVIVEYGFIDSPGDDVEQIKNNYKKYAEAVVKAICDYKKITYVAPLGSDYYTVVKGDSLWSIANKYGLTVSKLKELNNLNTNTLKVGQTLKVVDNSVEVPDEYILYKVKNGDSLWKIANTYNTTVDALKNINNLSSNSLKVNQQLFVPKNNTSNEEDSDDVIYTVVKGDNLWNIANKYNTSVNNIKTLNNLSSNTLQVGQKLKIPSTTFKYTVVSGDSLWKIANKYNTSVNTLKSLNNLSTNTLQIGQKLLVPNA